MPCQQFEYNEILHRSCSKAHFDYVDNKPLHNAFLLNNRDQNKLSVQPLKNRTLQEVIDYFRTNLTNFGNHCGYSSFYLYDCLRMPIECCDDSIPPSYYHAHINPLKFGRLALANFLLTISTYTSY